MASINTSIKGYTMAKKDLSDYITTVKQFKPSAEVKFRSKDGNGDVTERVASREYIAKHASAEVDAVSKVKGLTERLNKVTEKAVKEQQEEDDLDDIAAEVEDEEMLGEATGIEFVTANDIDDGATSPMTRVPNAQHESPNTAEMSETAMLIKLVATLIDKIDSMQNFNPVIHVPAPVIHVTLPETKRTVTKAIERDENNLIKTVHESIEEKPAGEPLIEVKQAPKPRRKTKPKDSE
jgi:hypothetical protein